MDVFTLFDKDSHLIHSLDEILFERIRFFQRLKTKMKEKKRIMKPSKLDNFISLSPPLKLPNKKV